jgi:hypothetical protein
MGEVIRLNDLLCLEGTDLKAAKVKFNQWNGSVDPIEAYVEKRDEVNGEWLFWRAKVRSFNVGNIAICFVKMPYDTWPLTTVKRVTKELGVTDGINYEGEEIDSLKQYFGRVVVRYHKKRSVVMRLAGIADELEVVEVLPSIYDGENFPGYDKVRLSYPQLKTILDRHKSDWVAALENQKAVYLITNLSNGKQYVGSATGDNGMLLERWSNYVKDGHGGDVELKDIVAKQGFDHVKKYFQYSILENYNARVDKDVILQRESWWKTTLGTREFGYNGN